MPKRRCVAVMVDLDGLEPRQRAALRGVRRFAAGQAAWQLAVDPFAATRPAARYDGILALAGAARAANAPPRTWVTERSSPLFLSFPWPACLRVSGSRFVSF